MPRTSRQNVAGGVGTLLPASPSRGKRGIVPPPLASASRLDQIRKVGCHLLFHFGYSGMTMREIASTLDIKAASLYYHFPSKQDILFDLMQGTVSELLRGLQEISESGQEPEQQLDAAIRWHVLFHTQKKEEAFISHSELRSLEEKNFRVILKLRQEYERLFDSILDSILKRGRRKGVFQVKNASVVRNCILTMCTATAGWFSPEGPLPAEAVADEIGAFVRSALLTGEAVPAAKPEPLVEADYPTYKTDRPSTKEVP